MNQPHPLLNANIDMTSRSNAWWRIGRVLESGLGAHEKLLLVSLVRLDGEGQGVEASWAQLADLASLSPSAVRRASENLELLELLRVTGRKAVDGQPLPSVYQHLLGGSHLLLSEPRHPTLREQSLEDFLALRGTFEKTLGELIEQKSERKGPRAKRQGRANDRAPRPWRQDYGPQSPEGKALVALNTYAFPDSKGKPLENMASIVKYFVAKFSWTEGQLAQLKPSGCLGWYNNEATRKA